MPRRWLPCGLALVALAALLTGCFSPDLPPAIGCGVDGTCPPMQRCEMSTNMCVPVELPPVTELRFESQPGDVEATVDAPPVVLELRDATGAIVPLTGGSFAIELGENEANVRLSGTVIAAATDGVVRFDTLQMDRPARGLRLVVHGGAVTATSERFDVTTTRPAIVSVTLPETVDGCSEVGYRLRQAQSQPVDLLVEFDPDGAGPLPFRRATQAPSAPGKGGVQGVPGSPTGRPWTFSWNTTDDVPGADATGVLRLTPSVGSARGAPTTTPVTVHNAPRFAATSVATPGARRPHVLDGDRDGHVGVTSVDPVAHLIHLDGMDDFSIPAGDAVRDYALGDLDGDGLLDLIVGLSTRTVVAFQERSPRGHLAAGVDVSASLAQILAADLDHDGLADLVGVEATSGDVVILRASRANRRHLVEAARPWRGGDTGRVAFADLDRDGGTDLVVGRASAAGPVAVLRATSVGFAAPSTVSGLAGHVLAVGDLDLDGRDDVATLDASGLHVSVASASARVDVAGLTGQALAVRDVNGDGLPDLVVATADRVLLHLHAPARHTVAFLPPLVLGAAAGVSALLADDFDRDGRVDVFALGDADPTATVVRFASTTARRCNGRLGGPILSFLPEITPGGLFVDINADGKLDNVAADATTAGRIVASFGHGDGSFDGAVTTLYSWTEASLVHLPSAADLDRDGAIDLVFPHFERHAVALLYNAPASPGTLDRVELPIEAVEAVAVGDLDQDGVPDLVVVAGGQVQTRRGDAQGRRQFGEPVVLATPVAATPDEITVCNFLCSARLDDLDGDGDLDLLVNAYTKLFVYLADPAAPQGFREPIVEPLENRLLVGLADLFGDARPELVFSYRVPADGSSYRAAYRLDAAGTAFERVWEDAPNAFGPDDVGSVLVSFDLDGDGANETLLGAGGPLAIISRDPTAAPRPPTQDLLPLRTGTLQALDLDGDGRANLVALDMAIRTLREDGPGSFDLGTRLGAGGTADPAGFGNALALGDFSGDGLLDVATRAVASDTIVLARQSNEHPGTLDPDAWTLPGSYFSGLVDLDGDRRADLVTYGAGGSLFYLHPDGASPAGRCQADENGFPFAAADVDGDGRTDLVVAGTTEVVLLSALADACPAPVPVMSLERAGQTTWPALAVALVDMNRDGLLDVVVATDAVRVALQRADAPGSFAVADYELVLDAFARPFSDLQVADVDLDGLPDVVVLDDSHAIRLFLGDAENPGALRPSTSVPITVTAGTGGHTSLSVGDVNGDGLPDVVTGEVAGDAIFPGASQVYLQTLDPQHPLEPGHFAFAYATVGARSTGPDVERATVVDFDGDGRQDLVYVDPAQGTMLLRGR